MRQRGPIVPLRTTVESLGDSAAPPIAEQKPTPQRWCSSVAAVAVCRIRASIGPRSGDEAAAAQRTVKYCATGAGSAPDGWSR